MANNDKKKNFLSLFVNKVSKFHPFILYYMHCMSCIWVWLVASCMEATAGVRLRMNKPFWCGVPQCHRCPFVLFSYYSNICAFCPFIAFFSPLIFLQQRLLESLIQAKKWGVMLWLYTFWYVWCPNFTRTTLLPLCLLSPSSFLTLCHDSFLILDSFCFGSLDLC
jgi:hypothetical protein